MKTIKSPADESAAVAAMDSTGSITLTVRLESPALARMLDAASPEDRQKVLDETGFVDRRTLVMDADALAKMLSMSKGQVYTMAETRSRTSGAMKENPLPVLRINGNLRFRKSSIDEWLLRLEHDAEIHPSPIP